MVEIARLMKYPIKSCGGFSVQSTLITANGFQYDRQFMVVDKDGKFISQRRKPKLCLVGTMIDGDNLLFRTPGFPRMMIPLVGDFQATKKIDVEVHGEIFKAYDQGTCFENWFSDFLGMTAYLVRVSEREMRKKEKPGGDMVIACHDSSPIHIISEESLADLRERIEPEFRYTVAYDRFRPNIILRGCKPYAEETYELIKVKSGVTLQARKKTVRCGIISKDQTSGEPTLEPYKTLVTYKANEEGKPTLGMYYIPRFLGRIALGQEVL